VISVHHHGFAPAAVLVIVVLLAGFSAETGAIGAAGLAVASVGWLLVNGPVEGPTLFVVAPGHGLTGADLAGLTGIGLAAWRGYRAFQAGRRRS
jgi:hypothetical protein